MRLFQYPIEALAIDPKTFQPIVLVDGVWMTTDKYTEMIKNDKTRN